VIDTAERQVYRRASFTRVMGCLLLCASAVMFAMGGYFGTSAHPGVSSQSISVLVFVTTATGVAFVVLAVAQLRSRLQLNHGSVRVVNLFAVHAFPAADIQDISIDRYRIFARACVLHLRDGATIGVWALPGVNPGWGTQDEWMDRVVVELRTRILPAGR
jgi:hypothetical protein